MTISLPVEAGSNQEEALEACLAALATLGITARPASHYAGRARPMIMVEIVVASRGRD